MERAVRQWGELAKLSGAHQVFLVQLGTRNSTGSNMRTAYVWPLDKGLTHNFMMRSVAVLARLLAVTMV